MAILLLGATGRTGKHLLQQALQAGFTVHALVRDKNKVKLTTTGLILFESKTIDKAALQIAIQGCDAVLSTLNISRKSDFPWSSLRTPSDFLSTTARNLIEVMEEEGVKRVIVTSAWGVSETRKDIPAWFKWFIDNSNIGVAYRDHEQQERLWQASDCDWSTVRPVGLIGGKHPKKIRVSRQNDPKPNLLISRSNVARFMLALYREKSYLRQAVTISEE
jgi:uncharacterized protein YbjT (DUF2867 family)